MNIETRCVNVDIACLMDMRLGAFTLIGEQLGVGPDIAVEITSDPLYYVREDDFFKTKNHGMIDLTLLRRIIDEKAHQVFSRSVITRLPFFLAEFGFKHFRTAGVRPKPIEPVFLINFYPLTLSDSEKQSICNAVSSKMSDQFQVKPCYIQPVNMTPAYLNAHYCAAFFYDLKTWVDPHADLYQLSAPNPHLQLFSPRIRTAPGWAERLKEQNVFRKSGNDEWTVLSETMQFLVPLDFIPAGLVSAATPLNILQAYMP